VSQKVVQRILQAFSGNAAIALSHMCVVVLIGRLGGKAELGSFAYAAALVTPVMLLCFMGLRVLISTAQGSQSLIVTASRLRTYAVSFGFLVVASSAYLFEERIDTRWLIVAVAWQKLSESPSDFAYGIFQRFGRLDLAAKSMFCRGFGAVGAAALVLGSTGSVSIAVAAIGLVWIIVYWVHDRRHSRRLLAENVSDSSHANLKEDDRGGGLALFMYALPLSLATVLFSLNSSLPRLFLERYWGPEVLGEFAAAAYVMVAGELLVRSVNQAQCRELVAAAGDKKRVQFWVIAKIMITWAVVAGVLLTVFGLVLGRAFFSITFGEEFVASRAALVALGFASMLLFPIGVMGYLFSALGRMRVQLWLVLSSVAGSLVSSALFIPLFGAVGGGLVMATGAAAYMIPAVLVLKTRTTRISKF
jgi:O-antigen/teichoic acid export membrane protein